MFRPTTNVLSFATGGTERVRIDASGNLQMVTTTVIDAARNLKNIASTETLNFYVSGSGHDATNNVNLGRGGRITFYGDSNAHHSIGSRGQANTIQDDLTISSYGAVYIDLDSNIFGFRKLPDLIHQYIRFQNAKSRQGSHKTKTRSEVSGKSKKPFSQKGTGNARQGSNTVSYTHLTLPTNREV